MSEKLPISVCMISGAEAHRIARALESVHTWVAEIIIVLNQEVTDGTEAIATQYGAKVYREPWKGHIDQKNSAASKATQPWILGLDADEVVTPELQEEIKNTLRSSTETPYTAFHFPRLAFFMGRWIRHGDWYPDRQLRLWKRGHAHWAGINPHDHLQVEGKIGRLHAHLLHYTNPSINEMLDKIAPYSDGFLENFTQKKRKVHWLDLAIRPFHRFFRGYILKRGFLDGWQGYFIAWVNSFSSALRYCKVLARKWEKENPDAFPPPPRF